MKKVSVGNPKDVSPKKGKKKGFIIIAIVVVILIALYLMSSTGCSNKKSTTTTTVPTPTVMPIPDRVSGLETRVTYLEQHPASAFDPTGLQSQIDALHNYDDTALVARVAALENGSTSNNDSVSLITFNSSYTFFNGRIATLEAFNWSSIVSNISTLQNNSIVLGNRTTVLENLNISSRLSSLESWRNSSAIVSCSTVPNRPVLQYPFNESVGIETNTSLMWESALNASSYKIWVTGISSISTSDTACLVSNLAPNTTYTWKVTATNNCGSNDSIIFSFTTKP